MFLCLSKSKIPCPELLQRPFRHLRKSKLYWGTIPVLLIWVSWKILSGFPETQRWQAEGIYTFKCNLGDNS